ncbi:glycerate kinase [Burkholderia oklahomensis]|uniref:glycerate kinase family protein n=1 Tax=Burkholderia oklahomensis TaxID=342113 RepID=UPI00016A916B|nr:glycerate kinase [Burkholderia oklahomensis]AJX36188.1 glycerate kinase family protein [Burkholderia oklahomensis C6786]AOI47987.1 glycerate kinase [Burkholderia oklahomensis C6786]KUY50143.1 glycerate kinase [Burkholderia oklahomensis C6786]MBI0363904.1 glycerate kinase [Burkholderia oklahomensis]SUY28045.1 Glycerate kinase [Burkholderia oklahomensis]
MKIVIAPDSFKESLTAVETARQIEAGFREVFADADYRCLPIADGGEGTVDALVTAASGERRIANVGDPLGRPTRAAFGILPDGTAVIEMAEASGLHLVPPDLRDPRVTSSRGTGELIRAALDAGARRFIVGLGGSATNDGGAGMLQALGAHLADADGRPIGAGGAQLARLARIDVAGLDSRLADCTFEVACDVDNPLVGPNGASAVFGPQKGATPEMIAHLDHNLAHFAAIIERDVGPAVAQLSGGGAAGGLGAAMSAFLTATLRPGIEIVTDALRLRDAIRGASLVVTGEGCIDGQTLRGKAPIGVARIAAECGVPVVAIGGAVTGQADALYRHGIDAIFASVRRACTIDEALRDAAINVRFAARNVAAAIRVGWHLGRHASSRRGA